MRLRTADQVPERLGRIRRELVPSHGRYSDRSQFSGRAREDQWNSRPSPVSARRILLEREAGLLRDRRSMDACSGLPLHLVRHRLPSNVPLLRRSLVFSDELFLISHGEWVTRPLGSASSATEPGFGPTVRLPVDQTTLARWQTSE